jgi:glutaredoxin 3
LGRRAVSALVHEFIPPFDRRLNVDLPSMPACGSEEMYPMSIVMYTKDSCPYCAAAKKLLQSKGVEWTEINIATESGRRDEMIERSGRMTVPQIFIGETHVGGFDDLARVSPPRIPASKPSITASSSSAADLLAIRRPSTRRARNSNRW